MEATARLKRQGLSNGGVARGVWCYHERSIKSYEEILNVWTQRTRQMVQTRLG